MYSGGLIAIIFQVADALLALLIVVLVVYVVISWLFAFDVVSRRNAFVNTAWQFTSRISDPLLRPLRRLIPPIAGVDLSVLLLLLGLQLFRGSVLPWLFGILMGSGPVL
jgi:YggT family protein